MSRSRPVVFRATAEPSLFMDAKFKLSIHYFATMRRAKRWSRRYLCHNPGGAVDIAQRSRRTGGA